MTIDEAIAILSNSVYPGSTTFDDLFYEAEKLGIEALNRVNWHKEQHKPGYYELLPGETEE